MRQVFLFFPFFACVNAWIIFFFILKHNINILNVCTLHHKIFDRLFSSTVPCCWASWTSRTPRTTRTARSTNNRSLDDGKISITRARLALHSLFFRIYSSLFYIILFSSSLSFLLFSSILGLLSSILIYSILFSSILFYSILVYSILFYSILFYSILFYSILLYFVTLQHKFIIGHCIRLHCIFYYCIASTLLPFITSHCIVLY